jgi:4-hydroxy-2-oxoglutarate aldolase
VEVEKKLMGIFAPISTPFTPDGEVDYKGLESNVGAYAAAGIKGYLALGSNGENKSLTNDEKLKALEVITKAKDPGQTVMAGCIFESTFETVYMARKMEELGPDYITLLPPSYFKSQMTDDALYKYFTDVADAISTPCLLYNAPQFSGGLGLSVNLLKRCAEHPNIVGVKDSSTGNMETILFALRDRFSIMSGTINNFFQCMTMGGVGGVLSFANVFPRVTVELYGLLVSKKYDEAIALHDRLLQINRIVSGKGGVSAVKYAMDLAGLVGGAARLPLLPLPEADKSAIQAKLSAEGYI